jgi:hypothetical protein
MMMRIEMTQDVADFISTVSAVGVYSGVRLSRSRANGMVPVFAGFGPRGLVGVPSAMLGRSRRAGRDAGISDW